LDGDVNPDDLILLAANWLAPGAVPGNCYADTRVDILDLALMAQKWLKTAP
jgi:hypothetical protein